MTMNKHKLDLGAWFRTACYVCLLAILGYMAVTMTGCTPRIPVDTDGDRKPDAQMSVDELDAWRAQDAARVKAEAKKVQRDAERAIKATDASNTQAIEDIKAAAEDAMDDISISYQARENARQAAIEDLNKQADLIMGVANDPTVRGLVGSLPGGNAILGIGGMLLGGIFGHSRGKAKGKDEGWQEREDYQAKIDATWEEGNSRKVDK